MKAWPGQVKVNKHGVAMEVFDRCKNHLVMMAQVNNDGLAEVYYTGTDVILKIN